MRSPAAALQLSPNRIRSAVRSSKTASSAASRPALRMTRHTAARQARLLSASSRQLPQQLGRTALPGRSGRPGGLVSIASAQPRQTCAFHRTALAGMPRRRNFFTSNSLLRSGGDGEAADSGKAKPGSSTTLPSSDRPGAAAAAKNTPHPQSETAQPASPAAVKRKPRAAGAKNSLRRVAVIAQQQPAARPGGVPLSGISPAAKATSPAAAAKEAEEAREEDREKADMNLATGDVATTAAVVANGVEAANRMRDNLEKVRAAETEQESFDGPREDGSNVISAVCLAESFNMSQVMTILKEQGYALDPDGSGFESHEVVHGRKWWDDGNSSPREVDLFVFESGTLVGWGLPEEAVDRLATDRLVIAAEDPFVKARETETLEFRRDSSRVTSAMRGSDVVILGTREEAAVGDRLATTRAQIAFSSGLARSTKLAALERSFSDYFESTRRIPAMLARGNGEGARRVMSNLSQRFIMQKTGELLSLRAQLNHYRELTDALPDIFWDSRAELGLEGYYEQVGRALDVGVRIKTLNQKMDYAQEIATVLREVSSERHGTRLEWIIIVLITVEVVFELRRVYLDWQAEKKAKAEAAA